MRVGNNPLMKVLTVLTLGFVTPACGSGPGDDNNNQINDGSLDASHILDAGDAGDASPLDAGLGPANCTKMGRTGIVDRFLPMLHPDTEADCDPVRLTRRLQDQFYAMCKAPNNSILAVATGSASGIDEVGHVDQQAEVPEGGSLGNIHPRNLVFFSPDGSAQLAVVPFNMEGAAGTVLSGAFVFDANGTPLIETQRFDFDTLVAGGFVLSYFGALGAEHSNGMVWFALENCDSAGECIASDVMGVPVVERTGGDWVMEDDIATWWTGLSGGSHRPTAISSVSDDVIVATFSGIGSNDASDWKRPQVAFYDTSAPIMLDDALRSFDTLGLTNSEQFVAMPTVPMTYDKRNFVLAAENPTSGENKVVALHVDNTSDVENSGHAFDTYTLPTELPNPARRAGSDDPATVEVGGVTNVIVDGARAYVTTAGGSFEIPGEDPNGEPVIVKTYGFLIALDIDVSTAAITFVGSVGVGIGPTVAAFDPDRGYLYQVVRTPNCGEEDDNARYLVRVDVDQVSFDPLP